jgi:hypothetical protein
MWQQQVVLPLLLLPLLSILPCVDGVIESYSWESNDSQVSTFSLSLAGPSLSSIT